MYFYRNILKKSWSITWRHKYLWFFGIFATLLGAGGEYDFVLNYLNSTREEGLFPGWRDLATSGFFSWHTIPSIFQTIVSDPLSFIILILVLLFLLALFCFLVWLVIISQIGTIDATSKFSGDKTASLKEGIDTGIKKFWPVFFLDFLSKAAISILVLFLTIFLLNDKYAVIFQILFMVFFLISLFIAFLFKYGVNYIIIKGLKFDQAVKEGWKLLKKNWLVTIEMALILFLVSIIVALITIILVFTASAPLMFFAILFYNLHSMGGFWLVASLAAILLLALVMIIGAVLTSFQISSWTIFFTELTGAGAKSKIERIFSKNK
jgi:hypothetical protein